ncbi:MAG: DUF547 domain-containing protein [Bacteroidota bacterium]
MKYFSILIAVILLSSCSGTKQLIESRPEQTKAVASANDMTKTVKTTEAGEPTQQSLPEKTETEAEQITLPPPPDPPKQVEDLMPLIHNRWNSILNTYVSNDGKVDYLGIKGSTEFDFYIDILLHNTPDDSWSKEQQLAYWINAYNALTVDLILRNYPLNSIKDIKDPWDQRLWEFGDKWLNLNDIEHKILRKMDEPRIHFAIVCASESCPKLLNEAFTPDNLEVQLTNATKAFLSDTSKNKISENNLELSKIFKWFAKDFKNNGSLIDFLNQYTEVSISNNAKKSFKTYDWSLNN